MSRPRRVLGYARVSSEEQARGTSLQDQQAAISAYAEAQGFGVTRFYVEAESGIREKAERRAQMQALMHDVREHDLVLVDKVDRWSRDPEFTYGSVRKILACGASFIAVGDALDASTPDGDSALGFRILFAREEHKRIRQRMVGTRRILRDKGYWAEGVVPLGYRRPLGVKGPEKNVLEVVAEEATVVQRVFRLAIAGRAISEIMALTALKRDAVKDILARRFYLGELTNSRGEWIRGKHPAIVDVATFQRARDAVDSRRWSPQRGAPTKTDDWILRDVARCGLCGAKMSAAYGRTRFYYRCTKKCTRTLIPRVPVEDAAAPMVLERLKAMRLALGKPATAPSSAPDFAAQRDRLERKRERTVDAFTEGALSKERLRERLAVLDAERLRIDADEGAGSRAAMGVKERKEVLRELATVERAWRRADGIKRRAIVRDLVVRAELSPDQPPTLIWREAEDLVAEE